MPSSHARAEICKYVAAEVHVALLADTARKLGRLTGLLIEVGRPGEAVPLLRRALVAAEDEQQVRMLDSAIAAMLRCLLSIRWEQG